MEFKLNHYISIIFLYYTIDNTSENQSFSGCMPGYRKWGYDICIRLYTESKNWFDASEECGKGRGYLFTLSIDPDISIQDLNSSFDFEFPEMWLGGYRNMGRFQWLAFYPNIINTSKEVRIHWAKEEPILGNDCLSGEMKEGNLLIYSRRCHEKKPFLCMHKFFRKEYLPHRCPKQWKSWPSVKNCYKSTNNLTTWKDAGYYCKNLGGRLAILHTPQVNAFVKNYISQHGCNDWWIGLRRTKHGLIWENNEIVRHVDWDRSTKFDFNNTAGYLKCNDYNMSWSLDNPNKKKMGICEMEMNRGRVWTKVEKVSDGVFKCSSNKRFYKSVTWYKDGIIVSGSRGLMNIDDDYLNLTENLLYTNKVLEKGLRQGYYWCEIYQEDPFVSVASTKMLFTYKNIWTFSGEFISLKIFNHLDPSTSEYWKEAVKIGERIGKYLLSKLKFQSAVYVHKLSRVSQKTKVEFLIYFQVPTKNSGTKKIDKEIFMKKLRNFMISNINSTLVMKNFKILPESLKIRNTDGCFREITEIEGQTLTWPRKYFGEIGLPEENCVTEKGEPVVRKCLGSFTEGTYWSPLNTTCSTKLSNLTYQLKDLAETGNKIILQRLSRLTSHPSQMKAIDLHYVALAMENLVFQQNKQDRQISLKEIIPIVNNLMDVDPSITMSAQRRVNASSRITASLETILENNKDPVNISESKLIVVSSPLNATGVLLTASDDTLRPINEQFDFLETKYRAGIRFPKELTQKRSLNNSLVNYIVYRNGSLFLTGRHHKAIASFILYAQITGESVLLENEKIEIFFETFRFDNYKNGSEKCVFWDYSLDDRTGGWSTVGCELRNRSENHIDMDTDIEENVTHGVILDVLTYFGCTLSIIGLLLTLITFILFEKLRKGTVRKVLFNLSLSILFSLIVFVSGINQVSSKIGCILVAALLHYLLLVSLCWMLVEAFQQYLRLVKVFDTYVPKFMLKATIFAWGFPIIVSIIIVSVDYNLYYGGKNYCWLRIEAFHYGFLLPVAVIMAINIIIFCMVIYSITCGRKAVNHNQSEKKMILARLRAAICIFTLLGLSWTFGFFTIKSAQLVFKYLFTISTTLQGFIIFVFHVVDDKSVMELWEQFIRRNVKVSIEVSYRTKDSLITTEKVS
ncbi:adhesion G-protein coupled receptor G6-like isoform X2 [Centruroides vittatus]|uniref:adhesion G-protein coupled receptor G6-like isoform X2 n=1 Tax=Centruroides vittatus TaxID=120091 RepID=UPI0035103FDD